VVSTSGVSPRCSSGRTIDGRMCSTTMCLFCPGSAFALRISTTTSHVCIGSICRRQQRSGTPSAGRAPYRGGTRRGIVLSHGRVWMIQRSKKEREERFELYNVARRDGQQHRRQKVGSAAKTSDCGGPQLSSSTTTTSTSTPHHNSNGVSSTLNWRPARPATLNTAPHTAHHTSPPRDTPQAPETPLHLHTAHHPLGRQLLHPAHDQPTARIQERERHTECAAVEPELTEAAERGGG
jgi:hypothetical protein